MQPAEQAPSTPADQSQDPRHLYARPPFPSQPQSEPGDEDPLKPQADHGETSYVGSGKLTDKVAVITGGDSGIGRAVALAYAREGADVVISYLNEHDDANETARLVREAGRRPLLIAGDIGDESHCQSLIQRSLDEYGHLDILVNNAAYQMSHDSLAELSSQDFERTFRTNVFALFYLCKAALPHMEAGASIINTTSIQGYQPGAELMDYAATKSAIISLTKSLAKQAIERGVRVNAVAPGPVWTPLIPATMPDKKVQQFGSSSLLGRPAQPAELAAVYVLLASKDASFITGEVYGMTGGQMPF